MANKNDLIDQPHRKYLFISFSDIKNIDVTQSNSAITYTLTHSSVKIDVLKGGI